MQYDPFAVNRSIQPARSAAAYKTFEVRQPVDTHFRKATCADVDCPNYLNGWRVRVEGLTPEALHTAKTCGRKFVELSAAAGETWLMFEAGQPCFRTTEHRVLLDRPQIFIARGGDFRGNPRGDRRVHANADDWVDEFANHQQVLADRLKEG
jgi:hypothetical protein